uniref:NADH-ubiquinone oxidoreductase chain 4 n=1 Tax=Cardiochiles fuscipennis TaxID=69312 RepID=A0A0A6ZKZ1_9HYME|nr:NADH dehydrogenase subunit 4 [Cardiochiles fuscipennis]
MMTFLTMNMSLLILNHKFMFFKKINFLFLINFTLFWMLNFKINNYQLNLIYYSFALDNLSFNLILLSIWIISLSMMSNFNFLNNMFKKKFFMLMIILLMILILCFMAMNMFMFYLFFELSIIPMIFLIMGWGKQIDRIQASMYLLFYTLFGSMPLLMLIFLIFKNMNTLMFNLMNYNLMNLNNLMMFFMLISAFLIKMPMYFVHIWLPKAHVEAPVSGSMILAGIMLKLGSYGMIRILMIFNNLFLKFNNLIMNISLFGGLMASLICLTLNDLKMIVAYSSIVHMSLLIASMMTLNYWGYIGSYLMMLAHGLSSSSLFYLLNLNYERLMSRNSLINKGLINILPSLSMMFFILMICNMSSPPSLNLISEIMMFNSLIMYNKIFSLYLMLISFFSSIYNIMLYMLTQHGKLNLLFFNFKMINCREFLILIMHWIPLNLFFLNMNFFY